MKRLFLKENKLLVTTIAAGGLARQRNATPDCRFAASEKNAFFLFSEFIIIKPFKKTGFE